MIISFPVNLVIIIICIDLLMDIIFVFIFELWQYYCYWFLVNNWVVLGAILWVSFVWLPSHHKGYLWTIRMGYYSTGNPTINHNIKIEQFINDSLSIKQPMNNLMGTLMNSISNWVLYMIGTKTLLCESVINLN